ncbi:MAG: glycosyltransferase family 2 protein, partial [Stenotrophomonas maltophilia]
MSPAIAAIIVSYQSASTLDACLLRLREARGIAEIRVVDNDSTDGTLEIVQRHASADPRVRFIANPDNPGFAAANNQGVADSQAPWLAFINPDLMVGPDTLALLRERALPLGDCLLGVEQVDEDGRPDDAVRRRDPDFAAMLRSPGQGGKLAIPVDRSQPLQVVPALSGA